jgi:hypothetical protein
MLMPKLFVGSSCKYHTRAIANNTVERLANRPKSGSESSTAIADNQCRSNEETKLIEHGFGPGSGRNITMNLDSLFDEIEKKMISVPV